MHVNAALSMTLIRVSPMKILRTLQFCILSTAIQAELYANPIKLDPRFLTQSDSNVIVSDVKPFPLEIIQLAGHIFKQPKNRYLFGLELDVSQATSKEFESFISLLDNNLVLGYEGLDDDMFTAAISSKADSKKVSIMKFSLPAMDKPIVSKSIEFKKFTPFRAIFFENSIAFHGQEGQDSMVQVMGDDLSLDTSVLVHGRQLGHDDLQVAGIDGIYKIQKDNILAAVSLHSTDESVFTQDKALISITLDGKVRNEYRFFAAIYDVYTSKDNIILAAITGEPGSFQLEVRHLDAQLKANESTVIPTNKFFPVQFKLVTSGERPLLAVLGVESLDVFDSKTGQKLLSFKSEYEITDLVKFLFVDGKFLVFAMLKDHPGKAARAAYFELPSNYLL